MGTASIHEGVRRMRFSSLLDRQERGEITQEEAAEMLGCMRVGRRSRGHHRKSWSGSSGSNIARAVHSPGPSGIPSQMVELVQPPAAARS